MNIFEGIAITGAPFVHEETFFYYDGPQTFAMRSASLSGIFLVVNAVAEDDETGVLTWAAVLIDHDRYIAMRSGAIPFAEIFTGAPQGTVWVLESSVEPDAGFNVRKLGAAPFPEEWVADPEYRLALPTQTVAAHRPSNVVSFSRRSGRTALAIEVERPGSTITEFPSKGSGELQIAIEGAIGTISKDVARNFGGRDDKPLTSSTLELRAASFVLVVAIESQGRLFENEPYVTETVGTLNDFFSVISSGQDSDITGFLRERSSAARKKLRSILSPLLENGTGIGFTAASPNGQILSETAASVDDVRHAVEAIDRVEPQVIPKLIKRGVLTGLNVRTRRFELFDSQLAVRIKGSMTAAAAAKANGFSVGDSSFVSAQVNEIRPFLNSEGDTVGVKYELVDIAEL